MVSTPTSSASSNQYITDYVPVTGGKSPLAMLAKTCETIGLPETPARKNGSSSSSPSDKKGSPPTGKKDQKTSASPKGPITTSFPAALAFPPLASFPFMGFPQMPVGSPFPMAAPPPSMMLQMMGMKPPCPAMLMGRPCTQPGCPSCQPAPSTSTASSPFDQMNPFLNPAAYQAFLAAAAAASSSAPSTSGMPSFPMLPPSLSLPSTSSAPPATTSASTSRAPSATKHSCAWAGCDKSFDSPEDLTHHLKDHVATSGSAPSTPTPSEKTSPKMTSSTPSASVRYNPYGKPSAMPAMPMPPMMAMGMNPLLMSGLFPQMRLPMP